MTGWSSWAQSVSNQLVAWFTRRRRVASILISAGVMLVGGGVLLEGFTLALTHESEGSRVVGTLTTGDHLSPVLNAVSFWIGAGMIVLGVGLLVCEHISAERLARRALVIVVELRGLIDTADRPLIESLPRGVRGQRRDAHVDVRSQVSSGDFRQALRHLQGLPDTIRRLRGQSDRSCVKVVTGGVLQVPLLFYAGVMLDDEGEFIHLDWDREQQAWRGLERSDDGERFQICGVDLLPRSAKRVVVSISASYATDRGAISATFGQLPVVSMSLTRPLPNTLWSNKKQSALAAQFLEVLAELGNRGVSSVDLVLAASSSLALRIGRAYDTRNLPVIRCYQYEKASDPPYPWCVEIKSRADVSIIRGERVRGDQEI